MGFPYLNRFQERVEAMIVWKCSGIFTVSVVGMLLKNGSIADSWTTWNPFDFNGRVTLSERCRGDAASYQTYGSFSYRTWGWRPWGGKSVTTPAVKTSC